MIRATNHKSCSINLMEILLFISSMCDELMCIPQLKSCVINYSYNDTMQHTLAYVHIFYACYIEQ